MRTEPDPDHHKMFDIINNSQLNQDSHYQRLVSNAIQEASFLTIHPEWFEKYLTYSKFNYGQSKDTNKFLMSRRCIALSSKNTDCEKIYNLLSNCSTESETPSNKLMNSCSSSPGCNNMFISNKTLKKRKVVSNNKISAKSYIKRDFIPMVCCCCEVRSTPQWRYIQDLRFCNACYMRLKRRADCIINNSDKSTTALNRSTHREEMILLMEKIFMKEKR